MLKFRIFGFPVVIHWAFWVTCAFLGGALEEGMSNPEAMRGLMAFIAVAFCSVLIHELGHAFTMRHYGDRQVGIMLYAFGGLASGSRHRTRSEDLYVSAAGPFLQIAAGVAIWWLKDLWMPEYRLVRAMLSDFVWISIFWAILNLVPVIPLDGGHITLALLGPQRVKLALWISFTAALALGVFAIATRRFYSAAFCGMLAFNNWKSIRGEPQVPWMASR